MFSGTDVPPRAFRFEHSPRPDQIDANRRIDPDAPLVEAYLGGRPVVLARPDQRTARPGEGADFTTPITISRLRHAIDIERGLDTGPFRPSLVEYAPLGQGITMYGPVSTPSSQQAVVWGIFAIGGALGGAGALALWKGRSGLLPGMFAGLAGGLMAGCVLRAITA